MIFICPKMLINNIAYPDGICLEKCLLEVSPPEKILMKEKLSALLTGNKQAFEDILIHQFEWMTLEQVLTPLFWGGEGIILGGVSRYENAR